MHMWNIFSATYRISLRHTVLHPIPFCLLLCVFGSSSAWAFRCGTDLVTKGDSRYEVLSKCGSPFLKEQWQELKTLERSKHHHSRIVTQAITIEEWAYNLGSAKFIQYLRFVDGRLVKVESGRRGFSNTNFEKKDQRCGKHIRRGDRKLDVLIRCGEPSFRDENLSSTITSDVRQLDSETQASHTGVRQVDEWVYDFGSRSFTLSVFFVQGKVVDTRSGDYGR